jgi:transposase
MRYVGIDYHNRYFVATVVDEEGRVIRKDTVSTDRRFIKDYFNEINAKEDVKAVLGECHEWSYFYDEIKGIVKEVKLTHPLKTRLTGEARIKTNFIDSDTLAHLLRADLIAEFKWQGQCLTLHENTLGSG